MALCFSLSAPFTPLAAAPEFQDKESIRDAAASFLKAETGPQGSNVQIEVGRFDERLTLAACSGNLETFLPPGGRPAGNTTVGVRCVAPKPWTIYVSASVKVFAPIVATRRALPRGATLKTTDLVMRETEVSAMTAGYVENIQDVTGKQLKMALNKGAIVTPRNLEEPRLVRRGERVIISAQGDGLDIRMDGKALADGTQGERIRVQNLGSRRIIDAIVTSAGMVEVQM